MPAIDAFAKSLIFLSLVLFDIFLFCMLGKIIWRTEKQGKNQNPPGTAKRGQCKCRDVAAPEQAKQCDSGDPRDKNGGRTCCAQLKR